MPVGGPSWPTTTCAWPTPKAPWPSRPATRPGPGRRSPGSCRPTPSSTTPPTASSAWTTPAHRPGPPAPPRRPVAAAERRHRPRLLPELPRAGPGRRRAAGRRGVRLHQPPGRPHRPGRVLRTLLPHGRPLRLPRTARRRAHRRRRRLRPVRVRAGGGPASPERRGHHRPGRQSHREPGLLRRPLLAVARRGLALPDPAQEAGGVGLVAVEELEPFRVPGLVAFLPLEAFAEGGLDVVELGAVLLGGPFGGLAPAKELVLGFGQAVGRGADGAEVGEDQVGRVALGEPVEAGHGQVAVEVGRRR